MFRKTRRMWRDPYKRNMITYVLAAATAVLVLYSINTQTVQGIRSNARNIERTQKQQEEALLERCKSTNLARREGNRRGHIIKEFLITAAESRRASALGSTEPWERILNIKTANRYEELATQITDYPYLDCDGDGKGDIHE